MGKINKQWHLANEMPKRATFEQRVEWHGAHLEHCACRTAPPAIAKALEAGAAHKDTATR